MQPALVITVSTSQCNTIAGVLAEGKKKVGEEGHSSLPKSHPIGYSGCNLWIDLNHLNEPSWKEGPYNQRSTKEDSETVEYNQLSLSRFIT